MKDEVLATITVCTDTETGIETIGEFDSGVFCGRLGVWVRTPRARAELIAEAERLLEKLKDETAERKVVVNGIEIPVYNKWLSDSDLRALAGFLVGKEVSIEYHNCTYPQSSGTLAKDHCVGIDGATEVPTFLVVAGGGNTAPH